MILFYFIVFSSISYDRVTGNRPASGSHSAGSSSLAASSANSFSSPSRSSSSSLSSSSATVHGCNDFNRCKDRNATYKSCPNPCPGTCENPDGVPNCLMMCQNNGCECNPGYVVSDNGKCILLKDCPDYLRCRGDRNATFKKCPNPCSRTCQLPGASRPCNRMCLKEGCECKEGYYLNEKGYCVQLRDCPGARACTANETFVLCNVNCRNNYCPVDDSRGIIACSPPFPCRSGCSCKRDYLRLCPEDDRCILASECPPVPCKRPNEEWSGCPPPCLKERCSDIGVTSQCDKRFFSCRPQCICKPGFYRNDSDVCVPEKYCPPKCGYNEMPVKCKTVCPPQRCEISYTEYACGKPTCEPGCDCLPNYLRNGSGICIPNEKCPPPPKCGYNEMPVKCKTICPPQRCEISYTEYACGKPTCEPGCDCLPNYLRNASGICIPNEKCPPPPKCGYNEMPVKCKTICPPQRCEISYTEYACGNTTCEPGCDCLPNHLRNASGICIPNEECRPQPKCNISHKCRATCANPSPQNCSVDQASENQDGCKCKPGYILSHADGVCIRIEECPGDLGCNGDPNAIATSCPWPSPSTCDSPNAGTCGKKCKPVGCQCKPGYILNKKNGVCILPEKCKCGNPCGINGTFSDCAFPCPNQYCPKDDSGSSVVACKPGRPCPSGCLCKEHYKRTSDSDDTCVLASDCPIVNCTKPNEVWNPCASECLAEKCADLYQKTDCFPDPNNCQPRCVCCEGFYRNRTGYCVPKNECKQPKCNISHKCRATCANPSPQNCSVDQASENQDGCKCKPGYILSHADGVCIRIEECPGDLGCNGDPNAIATSCPWPSPSTCDSPNAGTCGKKCKPVGCQCKPGYILNKKNGVCILPEKCKCGNPCGINGTFSDCAFPCPNQYCPKDDSGSSVVACKPGRPCPSGCLCKEHYKRTSDSDDTCVLASDCPIVNCTKPNEVWNPCASECLAEKCADLYQKTDCFPDPNNCQPRCVCCEGFYRNRTGYCVPKNECKPPCKVQPECRPTCAKPNPPGCPFIAPSETNEDGCNCQQGYILSEYDGKCIKIDECPSNIGCNGDPHARVKECPQPCPSSCDAPNAFPCKRKCDAIGCECEPGYIHSNIDGLCILPDQCKGGNPCGPNATFACKYNCPDGYCPTDDSRAKVICETFPFAPCFTGCVCKLNHKILSRENPICIRSDECPAVNCTRPHEEWNPCPMDCRSEYCEDVDKINVTCNTLVLNCNPRCVCKKSYFRDPNTDICVSSNKCRRINMKNPQQCN